MRKQLRLRNRADFSRVYRGGKSYANSQFVVYISKQHIADPFRLGISTSKKIGNAVVRNRMRRVVKEIVRKLEPKIAAHAPQIDIILIVRKPAITLSYIELEKSISHVFKRAGILQAPKRVEKRKASL